MQSHKIELILSINSEDGRAYCDIKISTKKKSEAVRLQALKLNEIELVSSLLLVQTLASLNNNKTQNGRRSNKHQNKATKL